ncbi:MAG TPA: hypothetical protein VJ831_13045 [Jatrophihabitantaceae bacterium]|nr:hypothetical protein [Jatrophihabitantaceae bacterium]
MWKQLAVGGAVTAAIAGIGTAAVATSGTVTSGDPLSAVTASANGATAADRPGGPLRGHPLARRALHGTWVTRDGSDKQGFVTHSEIRGSVTAVSATSITVKAEDGFSATYVVNGDTKVRERADKKGTPSEISKIKSGDSVAVVGKGSPATATAILKIDK